MAQFSIKRSFDHRGGKSRPAFGHIGDILFTAEVRNAKANGKDLPDVSVEYLLNFACQCLQDAYAGSDTKDEAVGAFDQKFDSLLEGTIGVRGGGVSDIVREIRSILRPLVKDGEGWSDMTEAEQNEAIDETFATYSDEVRDKVTKAAEESIAAKLAEAKRKAELRAKVGQLFADDDAS